MSETIGASLSLGRGGTAIDAEGDACHAWTGMQLNFFWNRRKAVNRSARFVHDAESAEQSLPGNPEIHCGSMPAGIP
jgi:hypothetical protein